MTILDTLTYEYVDDLLFVIHTSPVPTESDWNEMVAFASSRAALRGVLVWSPGAKPNANMRSDIRELQEKFSCKCAVLTNSSVSKGVMTALSWFNVPIKGFSPSELQDALEFVGRPDMLEGAREVLHPYLQSDVRRASGA
ncbi:MAG: STAS/SEC14 domain-containing protein [Deltaproteobacteria bacterium]|nr:STAS/SEC14 domain-containing protein [Deltaproteobacteria bacterium]